VDHVVANASVPAGCSAAAGADGAVQAYFNTPTSSAAQCATASDVLGVSESLVNVSLALSTTSSQATITLTGPTDVWFGVGFGSSAMKDRPWAVIVDGLGNVTERKLADQGGGDLLPLSVDIVSSSVIGAHRTVVLRRPLRGKSSDYFTFDPAETVLDYINAVGSGAAFAYHRSKTPAKLALLPRAGSGAVCLCASGHAIVTPPCG